MRGQINSIIIYCQIERKKKKFELIFSFFLKKINHQKNLMEK